jgi:sialate O-acetylesterase
MNRRIASLAAFLVIAAPARADVSLPRLVGDNMVLQRDAPLEIWGWADPGERVRVFFRGRVLSTHADLSGQWSARLPAEHAGGPDDMRIQAKNNLFLRNIMVGDVWLASGQSNMQFPMAREGSFGGVADADREIAAANFPQIRLFNVDRATALRPGADVGSGGWVAATPESVRSFSAVAYLFGCELLQRYQVPIGLIESAYADTPAETWVSERSLKKFPEFAASIARQSRSDVDADTEADSSASPQSPTVVFNAMIAPLAPYRLKGVIWYQGESNVGRAEQYRSLFPALIEDWRRNWGYRLPFLYVQLPGFDADGPAPAESARAKLRDAQSAASPIAATGMASAIDLGKRDDNHPRNEQDIAHRLALAARNVAYGEPVVSSSPTVPR